MIRQYSLPNILKGENDTMLTFAEFFAGIGLMRMGLEKQGWTVAFANDISLQKYEMYRTQFLDAEQHFLLDDINNITPQQIPHVDLATASFPCNDLSLAGGRNGINGTNSKSFWSFTRILEGMGEQRPQLVIIENVIGFLKSHNGMDLVTALQYLCRLGYSIDAFVIDAAHFVPQSRPRLFIIGSVREPYFDEAVLQVSDTRPKDLVAFIKNHKNIKWNIKRLPTLPKNSNLLPTVLEDIPNDHPEWWSTDRAAYLLNQMSYRHRLIAEYMISNSTWSYGTVFRRMRNGKSTAELRVDGIAGCLRTPRGGSAKQILFKAGYGKYFVRLITPRECARLMGANDYCITTARDQALFGFGDAVCVPVISWIAEHYLDPIIHTLIQESTNQQVLV